MSIRKKFVALLALLWLASCGGGGDAGPDAAPPDADSICGNPGDPGNSIGVGRFCDDLVDCGGTSGAPLCATLGDPMAHFCTRGCTEADPSVCGEDATCQCDVGGCGCFPDSCL